MKKLLLLTGSAIFAFASNANALEINPYVSAKLSHNWAKNDVISEYKYNTRSSSYKTKFHQNLWAGHFAAGMKSNAFRTELEWNISDDAKRSFFIEDDIKTRARLQNNSLLLNAYYDFHTCTKWTPYIGAGLGVAMLKITTNEIYSDGHIKKSVKSHNLAWQLGAGVAYDLTQNIALDAGYRYIDGGAAVVEKRIESASYYAHTESRKTKFNTAAHEIYFGARYTF